MSMPTIGKAQVHEYILARKEFSANGVMGACRNNNWKPVPTYVVYVDEHTYAAYSEGTWYVYDSSERHTMWAQFRVERWHRLLALVGSLPDPHIVRNWEAMSALINHGIVAAIGKMMEG